MEIALRFFQLFKTLHEDQKIARYACSLQAKSRTFGPPYFAYSFCCHLNKDQKRIIKKTTHKPTFLEPW